MSEPSFRDGGITGLWMAQRRAEESQRGDRLFEDPLAQIFVEAAGDAAPPRWAGGGFMQRYFAVRTRFFDDFLLAAAGAGCSQIALLAAGLDARAYRLPWPPGIDLYEVDQAGVLAFKERVLAERAAAPRCRRTVVAADLRSDWPARLKAAGFDPARRSAWLAEGIFMYLTAGEGNALVGALSRLSARGSRFALEHARSGGSTSPLLGGALALLAKYAASWKSSIAEPERWLRSFGWRATGHTGVSLGAKYERPVPAFATGWLIEAELEYYPGPARCAG